MSDPVQQIKDRLNIIDVVGPYVELHKAGKNFKGRSPFSSERTPSFYVSPDKGMYYCFSTSQGGDIFTFVSAMEGLDFKGALKILAEKAGVELVPEAPEKRNERDRLYLALEAATIFFSSKLAQKPDATEYLRNRGVKEETIKTWRVGYAPGPPHGGWRELKDALNEKGFTNEELLKAGLIKTTEGGKEPFDVFRDRIVFPLFDASGRVVGFSGRILQKDSQAPKYVNSPDTELYHKSSLLFGYDKAKNFIRKFDFSLIVEGQFDVVMSHQAGYHNTVAVSGTALTPDHVRQLERLSSRVVLALDADRAGVSAVKRGAELMLRRGMDVKVATLPPGQDPADIVKDDAKELKKIIGGAVTVIEFLLTILRKEARDDRAFKLRVGEEVVPYLLLLPNRIDQEHFVGVVAEALGSSIEAVRFEVERQREISENSVKREVAEPKSETSSTVVVESGDNNERQLNESIAFLLAASEEQTEDVGKNLLDKLKKASGKDEKELKAKLPPEIQSASYFIVEQEKNQFSNKAWLEELVYRLNFVKKATLKIALGEARRDVSESEAMGDEQALANALQKVQKIQAELKEELLVAEDLI